MLLNGNDTGYTPTNVGNNFGSLNSLDVTTGFIAGLNKVDFVVHNDPGDSYNPTGFRADLSGTAQTTGTSFGVLSTGVDDNGNVLADGAADTHYKLVSAPAPDAAGASYVTMQNGYPFGHWTADGPNSKWISPHANENDFAGGATDPVGNYTYETTFDLSGFNASTAHISGLVSADNTLEQVLLNGQDVGYTPDLSGTDYTAMHPLDINTGFTDGVNTLDFVVYNAVIDPTNLSNNAHNPSAFRAELTGTASDKPSDQNYTVLHDTPLSVEASLGVLAGASLSAQVVQETEAQHGTAILNTDGSFSYQPNPGYVGNDTFIYVVQSPTHTSQPGTVTISVTDQAPTSPDDSFQVHAGTTLNAVAPGLGEVATDLDLDPLTYHLASGTTHGALTWNGDGTFNYTPAAGFVGDDTFTYSTFDGALSSSTNGTVTITVEDLAPTAAPASFDVAAGSALVVDASQSLLVSTVSSEGDPLHAVLMTGPTHADQFVLNSDGTFGYTPHAAPGANFVGTDTFTYAVTDGTLVSQPVAVTINVSDLPIAHDDSYVLNSDGTLTVSATDGVLANDFNPHSNPDQYPLTAVMAQDVGSDVGKLTLNKDGSFTFSLTPNQPPSSGPITFGYNAVSAVAGGVGAGTAGLLPGLVTLWRANQLIAKVQKVTFQKALTLVNDVDGLRKVSVKKVLKFGADFSNQWTAEEVTTGLNPVDENDPIAYARNQTADLIVKIAVNDATLYKGKTVDVYGLITAGPAAPENIQATATLSGNDLVVQKGQLILPNDVLAFDNFHIEWYVLEPGVHYNPKLPLNPQLASWTDAGSTNEPLYLINKTPIKGTKLFHTVVRLGTAQMPAGATDDSITQAVMAKFSTLEIHKVGNAAQGLDGGPVLTYWNDYIASNGRNSTTALLQNNDGSCVAWTYFLLNVLRAQGITGNKGQVVLSGVRGEQLFVAQWNAAATPNNTTPGYPYSNAFKNQSGAKNPTATDLFSQVAGKWIYNWVGTNGITFDTDPTKYLHAQGESARSQPPLALFANHVVTLVTLGGQTAMFDPSYGKLYQNPAGTTNATSTPAQRQAALLALVKQVDQPSVIPFYGQVLPKQVNGNWVFVIRPNDHPGTTLVLGDVPKEGRLP